MGKIGAEAIWKLASAIGTRYSSVQQNVSATVTRIDDDGKVWVTMPGSTTETPCEGITHKVTIGDTVSVSTGGNTAEVTGSTSSPSVPDQGLSRQIELAKAIAKASKAAGEVARRIADQARQVAYATGQHFWHRVENTEGAGAGAFVTDVTREEFLENVHAGIAGGFYDLGEPDQSYSDSVSHEGDGETVTFALEFPTTDASTVAVTIDGSTADPSTYEVGESSVTFDSAPASDSEIVISYDRARRPWRNLLMNSFGILLRTGLNQLVSITSGAIAFFDGLGNNSSNITARFGVDGAQIGTSNKSHIQMDYRSLRLVDMGGLTYVHFSDLRGESGTASFSRVDTLKYEDGYTTASEFEIVPGVILSTVPRVIVDYRIIDETFGDSELYERFTFDNVEVKTTVLGMAYFSVPQHTAPSGWDSESGYKRIIIKSTYTTSDSTAKAYTAGIRDSSSDIGPMSFAMGLMTVASGGYSVSEGLYSEAVGSASHAEGYKGRAHGNYSHAQNYSTVANYHAQTAMGELNLNKSEDILEVGNGKVVELPDYPYSRIERSNAFAVQRDGTVEQAGRVAYPLYVYDTLPANSAVPVLPCFVLDKSDYGLYYFD